MKQNLEKNMTSYYLLVNLDERLISRVDQRPLRNYCNLDEHPSKYGFFIILRGYPEKGYKNKYHEKIEKLMEIAGVTILYFENKHFCFYCKNKRELNFFKLIIDDEQCIYDIYKKEK